MLLELLNACRDSTGFLSYELCSFVIACFLPSSWFNMEMGNLCVMFCFNIRESPGNNWARISRRKGVNPSPRDLFLCTAVMLRSWGPLVVLSPSPRGLRCWDGNKNFPKSPFLRDRMGASGCFYGRWLDWPHPVVNALSATIAVDFFAIEPRLLDRDPV